MRAPKGEGTRQDRAFAEGAGRLKNSRTQGGQKATIDIATNERVREMLRQVGRGTAGGDRRRREEKVSFNRSGGHNR